MIIKLSVQSKEYLKDLEIFIKYRLHSAYPLRELYDVTCIEREKYHESYISLIHLQKLDPEDKWKLENLINHAWQRVCGSVHRRKREGVSF